MPFGGDDAQPAQLFDSFVVFLPSVANKINAALLFFRVQGSISLNGLDHLADVAPQHDVSTTARHVGRNGDHPRAASLRHVRIRGLHVFAASNQRDASKLLATHAAVLDLAQRLRDQHGMVLEQIDLGGGLGIPYAPEETPLELSALGHGLADLLARHPWFTGELILEPGRFLVGPCGVYLARVVRTKESRGTRFAILEGGINHLLRPLLTGQAFPVKAVGRSGGSLPTTLAGPLCTSLDRLGEVVLPALAPGDLLAFGATGAYGFSEGMTHFLSHPVPPEVGVS